MADEIPPMKPVSLNEIERLAREIQEAEQAGLKAMNAIADTAITSKIDATLISYTKSTGRL